MLARTPLRRRGGLVGLLLVAMLGTMTGCGSNGPGNAAGDPSSAVSDSLVNDRIFECLSAEGFAVTRGPNGEVNFVDPEDEQFAAYQAALRSCRQALAAEGLLPAYDEEALRNEYRQLVKLNDCLAANGFATNPMPSEDVFLENYEELNVFALNTEEEWAQAKTACPAEMAVFEGGPGG